MMSAKRCTELLRRARIVDAGGETVGDFEPLLDLAQNQQAAVGRQPAAVEPGDDWLCPQPVTGQAAAA